MVLSRLFSARRLASVLVAPALVLGVVAPMAPAHAQKIKPDFWGMHHNEWTAPPKVPVGAANFTTTGTYWPSVETSPGSYDFSRLDAQVAAAERLGAQPMLLLGQSPRFHSSNPLSPDYVDFMPDLKAWERYATAVSQRYGARLDYQIWPEPNIIQNWQGTPAQMATLTAVASRAIKKTAGSAARVISPAVALRLESQQAWTVNYFQQKVDGTPVHRFVDAIAIDPFPEQSGTPEDSYKIMKSIKKKLKRIGVTAPFWNNEINYGVPGGGATSTVNYPMAKQQSYVIRTFALSAAAKMQRTYWLAWFKTPELAIDMTDDKGRALKPAKSYTVVREWLNKTNMKGCSAKKGGLWVCTAKAGKKEVRRIYWKTSGSTKIKTPKSTKRVEDQNGKVKSRGGAKTFKVGFKPIMVASKK